MQIFEPRKITKVGFLYLKTSLNLYLEKWDFVKMNKNFKYPVPSFYVKCQSNAREEEYAIGWSDFSFFNSTIIYNGLFVYFGPQSQSRTKNLRLRSKVNF